MAASPDTVPFAPDTLNPNTENPQPSFADPSANGGDNAGIADAVGEKRKRDDGGEPEGAAVKDPNDPLHPFWKTTLCSYFRREGGACSHGESCRFAHGESELRHRPDNSWDPTSERAKKAAKVGENGGERRSDVLMTDVFDGGVSDSALTKCLMHLPKRWNQENLKNFLDEQGIVYKSSKKKKGMAVGFVSFENLEQAKIATEELDGKSTGGNNLKVTDALPRAFEIKSTQVAGLALDGGNAGDSLTSNGSEDGNTAEDGSPSGCFVSKGRSAREVVTPLAHMSYADQLEHKKNSINQMLKKLTKNARKACPKGITFPEWILKAREIGGLPCKLEGIIESPLVNGYRNKCEFSIGCSLEGKPTVGFMLGNFREGVTAVQEPVDCPNVSAFACKYAAMLQEFLQESCLPIWNRFNNTGFWRQLTVREGRARQKTAEVEDVEFIISEVMLIVQVCSVGYDQEIMTREFEKMAQAFADGASANSPSLPLTALVVQDHKGISNVAPADAPLRPLAIPKADSMADNNVVETTIHDYISNLQFRISPTAFFQVNALAAEKLYSLAGDWANLTPDTLLFDICCGTGTIGLTLAHRVGMVVGIEMNASAVSDAHKNAEINGIKNCRFVCAKAEDVMGSLLKEYLDNPHKKDKLPSATESNGEEVTTFEEKGAPLDNVAHPKESLCCEIKSQKPTSGCLENNNLELEKQERDGCFLEGGSSTTQQLKNVVAIVDPPRCGLHPTVIKALRTNSHLRRLVYISCNPETLVANAIELCTPSTDKADRENNNNRGWRKMSSAGLARQRAKAMPESEPFWPVKATAVDLFPHTPHCEMVMLLER